MTTNVSYCHHEALSGNNPNGFKEYLKDFPQPFVGSADTNPISFSKSERVPGKMVIIRRKRKDVKNSLVKSFDKHPVFTDKEWDKYLDNTIEMFSILLDIYSMKDDKILQLEFEELEEIDKLVKLFHYCVPVDISMYHVENLAQTRITVKRREGMANGINATCKHTGKTPEEFKDNHIKDFDPVEWKQTVLSGWSDMPERKIITSYSMSA